MTTTRRKTPIRRRLRNVQRSNNIPEKVQRCNGLKRRGYDVYLVGGCVRDLILKKIPKDFDVITSAELSEVLKTFPRCQIVGRRFPICHVHVGDVIIESKYQEAIREISTSQASIGDTQSQGVDPLTKLQTWKDTVGGKKHSLVWGTTGLSSTFSCAGASIAFYTSQNPIKEAFHHASNEEWKKEMEKKHEHQGDKIERQEEELAFLRTSLKAVLQRLAAVEGPSPHPASAPASHPHYNDERD